MVRTLVAVQITRINRRKMAVSHVVRQMVILRIARGMDIVVFVEKGVIGIIRALVVINLMLIHLPIVLIVTLPQFVHQHAIRMKMTKTVFLEIDMDYQAKLIERQILVEHYLVGIESVHDSIWPEMT